MNQKLRFFMLALLCAVLNFAWGQADKSTTYTSNITLSTTGGTNASECEVSINNSGFAGIKAGSSKNAGAVQITVPAATQYLHFHAAGWKGETVKISVTKEGDELESFDLTSDDALTGSGSTFALDADACQESITNNNGYYGVIDFGHALSEATNIIISATSGKRFVIFGVNYEKKSNPSELAAPKFSLAGGTFYEPQTVAITTTALDADIYYTTDATITTPTAFNSTKYTGPITISKTTTIKAVTFKGGNYSEVVEATYTIIIPITGYEIDFEEEADLYTDWVFTNMTSKETGSITANGGTYYGTTGGKATASITTKNTIATPQYLTCYVSKQSSNTKESTWYIQVSEDGSEWTDVKTQDATSMAQGTWTEFTADLTEYEDVYVRVYYSGSTAIRNIDDLKLVTTPPSVAKPTITPESGTYASDQEVTIECETEGAIIYYTLDGTAPTDESTEYEGPFTVTESTVIKAIAYNGTDFSDITTAELTLPFANLAALVENMTSTETESYVKLTDALVTYKNGNNAYMEDATAGIYVYGCADNLSVGDKINGVATVKSKTYNNLPEITAITLPDGISKNNEVTPTELTIEELLEDYDSYLSRYVVIKGAEVTSAFSSRNSVIKQGESTINLRDQNNPGILETTQGMYVKVTGHPAIYNTGKQFSVWEQSQIVEMFKLSVSENAYDGSSFFATMANIGKGNFIVPEGVNVSIVEVIKKGKIYRHELIEAGSVIPGNEAYLVEAKASGIYLFDPTDKEAVEIPTGNMLCPTIPGQLTTGPDEAKSYVFYKLSLDKEGKEKSVGFYYGAANGVAFKGITANSAYLAVPSNLVQNTNAILINPDDDADGIQGISTSELKNAEVYTLTGVRIQGNLQKGIYIVNGRKQVIK